MSGSRSAVGKPAFLPDAIESSLRIWARRGVGALLLLICAACWASLVSWSANDPALTSATRSSANLLGEFGAVIADWLLQCFGFAAAIGLFAPTVWGTEMLAGRPLPSRHERLFLWPMSVIMTAGALAALPLLPGWPIGHGLGGLFGDRLLSSVSTAVASAGLGSAAMWSGLVLMVAALLFSAPVLGITVADLAVWRAPSKPVVTAAESLQTDLEPDLGLNYAWFPDEPLPTPDPQEQPRARLQVSAGRAPALTTLHETPQHELPEGEPEGASAAAWQEPQLSWSIPPSSAPLQQPIATPATFQPTPPTKQQKPLHVPYDDDVPSTELGEHEGDDDGSCVIARKFAPDRAAPTMASVQHAGLSWLRRRRTPDRADPRPLDPELAFEPEDTPTAATTPVTPPSVRPAPLSKRMPVAEIRNETSAARTRGYRPPSLKLLDPGPTVRAGSDVQPTALKIRVQQLETVLTEFGIKGHIVGVRPGPVVTLFELEPAPGLKTARVVGLADDIARSMAARSARVAAIPGRNIIGIELPNAQRETVYLRPLLESEAYRRSSAVLPIIIGRSIEGEPMVVDLAQMPHLLVAGTTGSGKSVGINAVILSLLYRFSPEQCRLMLIDPKVLELSAYGDIPHLLTPVVTEAEKAIKALTWAVGEMDERYKRMEALKVRNIEGYNTTIRNAQRQGTEIKRRVQTGYDADGRAITEEQVLPATLLPYIVIVIDEMADLVLTAGKDLELLIQRLAQKARAAGIHLITATQRPSVDVVTGIIKANLPARLSYRVASKVDSRTVLGDAGAEQLLGSGDLLLKQGGDIRRAHAPFVADDEVANITAELRRNGPPAYVEAVAAALADVPASASAEPDDEMYQDAVKIVLSDRKATISHLQRKLSIGYNRAANLIERMESDGIIGAPQAGKRAIL